MRTSTPTRPHRSALLSAAILPFLLLGSGAATAQPPSGGERPEAGDVGGTGPRVGVPYVTNRRMGEQAYGGERGPPGFGRCEVVFKPIPVINKIAPRVPFHVADETREVRFESETNEEAFWGRLETEATTTASGTVVVFVHGYNYGFERHCTVAAELQRTLQGKALVLMFSWPSNGRPSDYIPDQADVEWSVPFLAEILAKLADRVGPERVQVLAHSLGSRGVVFALERLRTEREQRPMIGSLVLMAPDYDAQTFLERLPDLKPLTGRITLYASSNDTPLRVSRQLHAAPRLGEAGKFLTVARGMETIDVSPLGRYQVLGHEYFLFHPLVAADLAVLIADGQSAAKRESLSPVVDTGLTHWELAADDAGPE
jgi:esterase/lipase superfamily enzyme